MCEAGGSCATHRAALAVFALNAAKKGLGDVVVNADEIACCRQLGTRRCAP